MSCIFSAYSLSQTFRNSLSILFWLGNLTNKSSTIARLIRIELNGTGYLLGRIYRAGRILKDELLENVSKMRRSGWRITEEDYEKIPDYLRRL